MNRIYCTVLWAAWLILNFTENKMASRKRKSQVKGGSEQKKYLKQSYLACILL